MTDREAVAREIDRKMRTVIRLRPPRRNNGCYKPHRYEPELNSGCWLWLLGLTKDGYGKVKVQTNQGEMIVGAHKAAYLEHVGEIPDGLFVLHRCDTPVCVNPDHLFLGTNSDNMADMIRKGRAAWLKKPLPTETPTTA